MPPTYEKLGARLATLPLVICGPMLRRITTESVTVFVALREPRDVTLTVAQVGANGGLGANSFTDHASTLAIGANLHVLAITAKGAVIPGQTYVYDLGFARGGATASLLDPGIVAASKEDARAALTYPKVPTSPALPSFTAPPIDPAQLRIIHYSCRKPHAPGEDALPTVNTLIKDALSDKSQEPRPHFLIHTGDQIYADDVADELLHILIDASDALLAWTPGEVLPIPSGPKKPQALRPGQRADVVGEAKFTSDKDARGSHLLGFGEFCAMYLHAWSPVLWPATPPTAAEVYAGASADTMAALQKRYDKSHTTLHTGYASHLTDIRRLLANVPSLMQFDDHEITDDWFRNLAWTKDAATPATPAGRFGQAIIRNGMSAFAVFQAWGNVPDRFTPATGTRTAPGAEILRLLGVWHGRGGGDDATAHDTTLASLANLLGLPIGFASDRATQDANRMVWSYRHDWPGHRIVVLDTRTQRVTPDKATEPPALMRGATEFAAQISDPVPTAEELVIVLSPAPVYGAQAQDFAIKQLSAHYDANYADAEAWSLQENARQELLARLALYGPTDASGVTRSRSVILSGDVHHAFTIAVDYQGRAPTVGGSRPCRSVFAALTSSAAKNQDSLTSALGLASSVSIYSEKQYGWANAGGGSISASFAMPQDTTPKVIEASGSPIAISAPPNAVKPPVPAPEWTIDTDPKTDHRSTEEAGRGSGAVTASGKTMIDRFAMTVYSYADSFDNRTIVGANNIGDLRFSWGTDDAKSVTHRLWFRLNDTDPDAQPYTMHTVELRNGSSGTGQALQRGDHDRDAAGVARYNGTDRIEAAPGTGLVRRLQARLAEVGFTLVGTPDGAYGASTEEAVRELQIAGSLPRAAQNSGPMTGPINDHVSVPIPTHDRYDGPLSGRYDGKTVALLEGWRTNGWRNPVVVRALQGTTVAKDDLWRHDEITDESFRIVVRDLSGAWTLPAGKDASQFHPAGRYAAAPNRGPVALAPDHVWPETEVLPSHAGAASVAAMDVAQRSTLKIIRAVSERECMGYLDSVATSDAAVLEAGTLHWTFALPAGASKAPGELAGFAAFLEAVDKPTFDAVFARFGLRPSASWRQTDGAPTGRGLLTPQRTYVAGWSRTDPSSPAIGTAAADVDAFRGWHWFHRLQMAVRTLPALRRAMYDFARIRARGVLTAPWGKTTGTDGVPNIAGRPAMISDVITSERSAALLLRWHVFRPIDIVDDNAAGAVLRRALAAVGRPAGDPASWSNAFEQSFLAAMVSAPPPGIGPLNAVLAWPTWHPANPLRYALAIRDFLSTPSTVPPGYVPPADISLTTGLLSSQRRSRLLDTRSLPPEPDYARGGVP